MMLKLLSQVCHDLYGGLDYSTVLKALLTPILIAPLLFCEPCAQVLVHLATGRINVFGWKWRQRKCC